MQRMQRMFFGVIALTRKYAGLVALFGFITGLISLWLVEKREHFAQFFGFLYISTKHLTNRMMMILERNAQMPANIPRANDRNFHSEKYN